MKCKACGQEFTLSKEQEQTVRDAIKEKRVLVRIRCSNCKEAMSLDPLEILGQENGFKVEDNRIFCCPVPQCTGFVEWDKDANVFGCAVCGTEWENLKKVYKDIDKIVGKYPHRKQVYKKEGGEWVSIPFEKIPDSYYNKVYKEE